MISVTLFFAAWGRGDPHITTLDTFEYIFNGLGEYTLIMIDSIGFKLQGRTEKAFDSSGAEVNTGTVFTAFVVSQGATTVCRTKLLIVKGLSFKILGYIYVTFQSSFQLWYW